jgi:hypothetical protein
MALLNEKNLAGEAARRARFRVHHVGTKLNEAEVRELEALATKRSQTHAELIRGLILREIEQSKRRHRASAEMVEITGEMGDGPDLRDFPLISPSKSRRSGRPFGTVQVVIPTQD